MSKIYVYDACALIAVLKDEPGSAVADAAYKEASDGGAELRINKVNLLEVYYGFLRDRGRDYAEGILRNVTESVIKVTDISIDVLREAGRLKTSYRISLADSIALAEAAVSGGLLLTADHHEFDAVEQAEKISFQWIR